MMEECDVDPEDDVIHFDSSQYRNQDQSEGDLQQGHQRKKSGTFSSTWSKVRYSFMSGSGKMPAPNQVPADQQTSIPTTTPAQNPAKNSPTMMRSSRSSNNISDMVNQQQLEEDRERESYRETRQRGVSVSSKQEASLLLTLQNSPSSKKSKNGQVTPPPSSQFPHQHPQTAPRPSRHSHSSGTRSTSASSSLLEPQSAPQRRKSQKQSNDGCLPS